MPRDKARSGAQPSFLVFITDQNPGSLPGCAGRPAVQTPDLDAVAEEGSGSV